MKNTHPTVLIVAPAREYKGGIAAVIRQMENTSLWKRYRCHWIQTQTNKMYIKKFYWFFSSAIIALFKLPKYDIIHFHTVPGISLIVQMPIYLWALLWRKKIIVHIHVGNQLEEHANSKIFDFVLSHASTVVVLSDVWKVKMTQLFPALKSVDILYNPAPRAESIPYASRKGKYIIFIAYLTKNKGYDTLIEAYASLCSKHSDWDLIIAGSGETEEAKQLSEKLGISNRVVFTGWIDGSEKAKLLANASCFCMASYMEGFPMSVLEAWAYGIPVVTTPVGGLPDVLEDGVNALAFTPGHSAELAGQLEKIMQDDLLAEKLIENGKRTIASHFDLEIVARSWAEIYESLN